MSPASRTTDRRTPEKAFPASESRLSLRQVRSVFRLLADLRDLGSSPLTWRRHLLLGSLRLVEGGTGVAAEIVSRGRPDKPRVLGAVIVGVREPRLVRVYRALVERSGGALGLPTDTGRVSATVVRTRQAMSVGQSWRQRPDLDPWRTLDCEYFICSSQGLPGGNGVHLIILTRPARARPFGEAERRVVALLHAELGRLWRGADDDLAADLPRPMQQTLELLLAGSSEGQIVDALVRSPHTVHDQVKRLYRHFHVNSRAQLLVRLAHSPLIRAPRLCVQLLKSDDDSRFDAVETEEAERLTDASATRPSRAVGRVPRG